MAITKQGYESDDSIEEQIRAAAEERSEGKMAPIIDVDEETPVKMPMRPGQKFSGRKTPIVTKEQFQAFKTKYGADKDLTDYMNAQQGLTRRRDSSGPSRSDYSNEGEGDSKYRKQTMTPESQALERIYPEQYLAMPGIKGIAAAAKSLAERVTTKGAKEVAKRIEPTFDELKRQLALPAPNRQMALPAPTKQIGYDKAGAKAAERSGRAEGRQAEMLKENARRSGLREDASEETLKAVRGGDKFTMMKRGGSAKGYASGGSVSASSRGDGIAQRGKTRGKMC